MRGALPPQLPAHPITPALWLQLPAAAMSHLLNSQAAVSHRPRCTPYLICCCCRLRARGFSAFIVGGWVRDVFLQRPPADIDIATSASPSRVRQIFAGDTMVDLPRSTVKLTHQGQVGGGGRRWGAGEEGGDWGGGTGEVAAPSREETGAPAEGRVWCYQRFPCVHKGVGLLRSQKRRLEGRSLPCVWRGRGSAKLDCSVVRLLSQVT